MLKRITGSLVVLAASWVPVSIAGEAVDLPPLPPLPPPPPLNDNTGREDKTTDLPQDEVDRVLALFALAQARALDFVTGRKMETTREDLIACVKDDPAVFNLVVTVTYKRKQQTIPVQHVLHADTAHMNIKQTSRGAVKEGVNIMAGFTEDNQPIWIASKTYPPPAEEKNFLGGEIMLLVHAKDKK